MIIGFAELILEAPESYGRNVPRALLADLAVIYRNSRHLSSLVEDVLDLSQIEAAQMALTKERVVLYELVEAAAIAVQPLYESKGLYLEIEIEDLPPVFCDPTRVRQVLLNLLSNAGRFTQSGGVRLRGWREGSDITVSVTDTGSGIAEEDLGRLFKPFQQLDASLRRHHGGTGLGLSISKAFIEQHGGRMWVDSEMGIGTTFFFQLPIDPPVPLQPSAMRWFNPYCPYEARVERSHAPVTIPPPRFVVLESGCALRRLLARYLDGIETVSVSSLEAAVEELTTAPALALLVNDATGKETLSRLGETVRLPFGIPAIVCSIPDVNEAADLLGVSQYLVKPVSRDDLLAALSRLSPKPKSVLIVDDEPDALRLFRRMLASTECEYRVLYATNGRQALDILHDERAGAILLDLIMPEMDGFEMLARKNEDPTLCAIPVVAISARDPAGYPIVSNALSVTCRGGLSVSHLLGCIQAITQILSTTAQAAGPMLRETPRG